MGYTVSPVVDLHAGGVVSKDFDVYFVMRRAFVWAGISEKAGDNTLGVRGGEAAFVIPIAINIMSAVLARDITSITRFLQGEHQRAVFAADLLR